MMLTIAMGTATFLFGVFVGLYCGQKYHDNCIKRRVVESDGRVYKLTEIDPEKYPGA